MPIAHCPWIRRKPSHKNGLTKRPRVWEQSESGPGSKRFICLIRCASYSYCCLLPDLTWFALVVFVATEWVTITARRWKTSTTAGPSGSGERAAPGWATRVWVAVEDPEGRGPKGAWPVPVAAAAAPPTPTTRGGTTSSSAWRSCRGSCQISEPPKRKRYNNWL